jgi:hypothetical protein
MTEREYFDIPAEIPELDFKSFLPKGKGTYGKKVGRPPKRKKKR